MDLDQLRRQAKELLHAFRRGDHGTRNIIGRDRFILHWYQEFHCLHQRLRDTGDYEGARRAFIARQPMGRLGRAEEIAALALYLASDESAFTTGATHVIDGGWIN